jgi:hypothetical protein
MDEYTNLSYEETKQILEKYFNEKRTCMIKFKPSPLKHNHNFDLPDDYTGLEEKFFGP